MSVGKGSLDRVAKSAAGKETPAEAPVKESAPAKAPKAVRPAQKIYGIGDALPVHLL